MVAPIPSDLLPITDRLISVLDNFGGPSLGAMCLLAVIKIARDCLFSRDYARLVKETKNSPDRTKVLLVFATSMRPGKNRPGDRHVLRRRKRPR